MQRSEFAPKVVHVGFVVDKAALGHVFPVSIIPPVLHIHSCVIWTTLPQTLPVA
jgi:hypothetical protein